MINDAPQTPLNTNNENDRKYSNITALINSGMPISEISKMTGIPNGEIELIKNLNK